MRKFFEFTIAIILLGAFPMILDAIKATPITQVIAYTIWCWTLVYVFQVESNQMILRLFRKR